MSKTDKTRPWRVRVMDKKRWLTEVHDHTDGLCDLPPRPALVCDFWRNGRETRCRWDASRDFWVTPSNYCGCPMCNDQEGRRLNVKRSRAAGRREADEAFKDVAAYGTRDPLDDFDSEWGWARRFAEEFGGFESEAAELQRFAEELELPETSYVIDTVINADYEIEALVVLHNDGRRQTLCRPGWHVDEEHGVSCPVAR